MPPWVIAIIVVAGLAFLAMFYGVFIPMLVKMNKKQKQEKHQQKIEKKKLDAEIEITKKQISFEIEKERINMQPSFCPYCGSKHAANAKKCSNCGSSLQ